MKHSRASGPWRLRIEAGYQEHLAIANNSLSPYFRKPSASAARFEHDRFAEIQSPNLDPDQISIRGQVVEAPFEGQQSSLPLPCCSPRKLHDKCDLVDSVSAGPHTHFADYRSYVQTGVVPGTDPYVGKEQSPPAQLEVDRMPSTVESSRISNVSRGFETSKINLARAVGEDEARLLGSSRNHDAEAVPIDKPMPRAMAGHTYKVFGGPRPTNTLGVGRGLCVPASQPSQSNPRSGEGGHLQFEVSRGSNVPPNVHTYNYSVEASADRPPKRQRTNGDRSTHEISSSSSANSDDAKLDGMDPNDLIISVKSAGQRPSQVVPSYSVSSQDSTAQKQKKSMLGGVQEHRSVEKMMSSNPETKKQRKSRSISGSHQRNYGESMSPPMSSPANPIDISANDDGEIQNITAARHMAHTTASVPHATTSNAMTHSATLPARRTNDNRSKFFANQSTSTTNGIRSQYPSQISNQRDNGKYSNRLNDNFVRVVGDHRTPAASGSSDIDELQSGPVTVGSNANPKRSIPIRRSHNNSAFEEISQITHPTSLDEEDSEKVQSNIKAEKFEAAKTKAQNNGRVTEKVREKKAAWSVELAAVSTAGQCIERDGMALVRFEGTTWNENTRRDEKTISYVIAMDGRFLRPRVRPHKVLKIQYSLDGRKARFQSMQIGTEDNVVDIEFRREKDMVTLLQNTDFQKVTQESRESEYMDKIFANQRSQYSQKRPSTQLAFADTHDDNYETKHRQESNNRSQSRDASNISQPHRGRKLIDDLCRRSHQQDQSPHEQQDLETSRKGTLRRESMGQGKKINLISEYRLTRPTRVATQKRTSLEEIFNDHDDLPQTVRYSKTHGLGDPWRKPLTYPLTGKKKTTVEFSDLERLDEGEYLNDSLISFQLRFLENTMEEQRPDLAKRVYFFNTFFYATLMNTHKGKKGFNYEGVQKWTRNVDLFTYDYIVVPINDSLHWYLAIICNLPSLNRDLRSSEEIPDAPTKATGTIGETNKSGLVSSSPTTDIPEGDSVTLVRDQKEEPDEQAARSSFAELSLDVQSMQTTSRDTDFDQRPESNHQTEEDQEMLDGQLQRTVLERSNHDEDQKAAEALESDPIEDPAQPPEVPGAIRKKKRKSMPPVTKTDPSKPAIITFDSLGMNRSATVRILKDYLREEAKAKRGGMEFDPGQIKGITASGIPSQENWYDCGLFLLGYVAKLLEADPKDFITRVIRRQYDVHDDWPELKPSLARKALRDQLMALHREQEAERRKERNALKNSKPDAKHSSKTRTPSRAVSPANNTQQVATDDRKPIQDAPKSPEAPSSPLRPATRDDAFKNAQPLPPDDFPSAVHQLMQEARDEDVDEQQNKARSPDRGKAEEDKRQRRSEHEPSMIIIENQSQPDEVARSFHQNHASQIPHRSPEKFPELPEEIPDSQPSQIHKTTAETEPKPSDAIEPPQNKKRDIQETRALFVEVRAPKRRKIDQSYETESKHFPRQENQDLKALQGRDPEAKARKRKLVRKLENTDEVINIDD